MDLFNMPLEIHQSIAQHLSIKDRCDLSETCVDLHNITKSPQHLIDLSQRVILYFAMSAAIKKIWTEDLYKWVKDTLYTLIGMDNVDGDLIVMIFNSMHSLSGVYKTISSTSLKFSRQLEFTVHDRISVSRLKRKAQHYMTVQSHTLANRLHFTPSLYKQVQPLQLIDVAIVELQKDLDLPGIYQSAKLII